MLRIGREAGQRPQLEEWLRKKWKNADKEKEKSKLEEGITRNTVYGSDEQGGMAISKTKMLRESECKKKHGDRVEKGKQLKTTKTGCVLT